MNERINDKIDRYLRKEMSSEETLLFEQEILNDEEMRKEVEVSFLIRKSLAGREKKITNLESVEKKKKESNNKKFVYRFYSGIICYRIFSL